MTRTQILALVLELAGAALLVVAASLVSEPLGFATGGVSAIVLGVAVELGDRGPAADETADERTA